ncbi:hypothetical protein MHYP_G00216600 [Metynnis hypsauchen]
MLHYRACLRDDEDQDQGHFPTSVGGASHILYLMQNVSSTTSALGLVEDEPEVVVVEDEEEHVWETKRDKLSAEVSAPEQVPLIMTVLG